MSFQLNMPPSAIAQLAKKEEGLEEEGMDAGKKREDWKKVKELEEARKAGTAPAMQDEEGKDINPHIPQYIMQAPWYFGSTAPTLKHQRPQDEKERRFDDMNKWYRRGQKEGPVATKFRKGACENCGAMTHKKKDCMERPRKIGAKFTGSDIAPDEYVQEDVSFDFEGKRDRWNGFDQEHHKKIVEEYAKIEEAKQVLKAQRLETGDGETSEPVKEDSGGEEDEDKYADDLDMPGHKFESKQRITVRNLRIREDTAKYLVNLDPNSAYYDPKTRSMRQNPYAGTGKVDEEEMYAGDNFVRMSGDARNYAERQLFAWQAYEKGTDAHLQADPTKLELLARDYKTKKSEYKQSVKQNILDKYGGEEHLEAPPKELLLAQSENYVEYSRHGTIIKGQERAPVKSIYEEDVYINNHTSVWGSYWRNGSWGFKCCYSIVKESYCTGESGREAALESIAHMKLAVESQKAAAQEAAATAAADGQLTGQSSEIKFNTFDVGCTTEAHKEAAKRTLEAYAKMKADAAKEKEGKGEAEKEDTEKEKRRKRKEKKKQKKKERKKKRRKKHKKRDSSSSESSSESESEEDEAVAKERRVKEAMEKEEKRVRQVERLMGMDERKRPYNSIYSDAAPTEDEIEAWRRKQKHFEDPMSHFM